MAQPAYDGTKHHVGLGPAGSGIGLMVAGGYRRGPQHDQGGSTEFGGDQDVGFLPGHSRWTQDDFSGGMYQDVWRDPAMFFECEGFRPLPYSRAIGSIPKGAYSTSFASVPFDYDAGAELATVSQPCFVFAYKGWLHFVYAQEGDNQPNEGVILSFDSRAATFATWVRTDTNGGTNVAAFHRETATLYLGDDANTKLWRYGFNATTGAWTLKNPDSYTYPTDVGSRPLVGMNAEGPRITCAFRGLLADLTPPNDDSQAVGAGSKQWAVNKRYKLPAMWRSSLFFNSQLYILLNDEFDPQFPNFQGETGWTTTVVAWDGSDLYPVVEFPYVFRGRTMIDYAGRVFVAGDSHDLGGEESGFAEIFEITGSSLRSVRSWGADQRSAATDITNTGPMTITSLLVFEGLLWYYNDSTGRAECYDITTDSFYGGPELSPSTSVGENDPIYRLVPLGNTLGLARQATTVDDASAPTPPAGYNLAMTWSFRGQEAEGSPVTFTDTHILTTSDFAYEPSRDKKLSEIFVHSKVMAPFTAYISTDGGDTYTELGILGAPVQEGNWFTTRYTCHNLDPAKRFRVRVEFRCDEDYTPVELHSITTLFTVLPSGKKAWSFTALGPERIEGRDHETVVQDVVDLSSSLFGWHESGETLVFTDIDGSVYNVRLEDVEENAIEIGPNVVFEDGTRPEAHFSLTLLEV